MANTAQTEPNVWTYTAYDFMQKILWPKKQTGSKKYIVSRSLTRTQIKSLRFKNRNIAQNVDGNWG